MEIQEDKRVHVVKIPLQTTPHDLVELEKSLRSYEQIYNAAVGECKKRVHRLEESQLWKKAKVLNKSKKKEDKQEAKKLFKMARKKYGFEEGIIQNFFTQSKRGKCWIDEHIDSQVVKNAVKRAFLAWERYLTIHSGQPKFIRKGMLKSLQQTTGDSQSIRWMGDHVSWKIGRGKEAKTFKLKTIVNEDDLILQYDLSCPRRSSISLVKKIVKGKPQWEVQLLVEGPPFPRYKLGKGIMGLDLGTSTYAAVCLESNFAEIDLYCSKLMEKIIEINNDVKTIQRKIIRSHRQNNLECFEEDRWEKKDKNWIRKKGKSIKGKRHSNKSNKCKELEKQLVEKRRLLNETKKTLYGEITNNLLVLANHFKTEDLSYKSWQRNKMFSKSIQKFSPSLFINLLKTKVETQGGIFEELSTQKTKLSQYQHDTDDFDPKRSNLNVRFKEINGKKIQRDLLSALYAVYVKENEEGKWQVDSSQMENIWPGAELLLEQAVSTCTEKMSKLPKASGLLKRLGFPAQRESLVEGESATIEASDGILVS